MTRPGPGAAALAAPCPAGLAAHVLLGRPHGPGHDRRVVLLALPTAAKAVGGHGHLEGVRKFTFGSLHGMSPRLYGELAHDVPKKQQVCLAAYTGHFTATEVVQAARAPRPARWRSPW